MNSIVAGSLELQPLTVAHAERMFEVLSDPALYEFLDSGPPPSVEHLRRVYRKLEARTSPNGTEAWLNWVIVDQPGQPLGYVQATITEPGRAWIAFVIGRASWGRGVARASTSAMLRELTATYGIQHFLACVEQANRRSIALLESLSFRPVPHDETVSCQLTETERLFQFHQPLRSDVA